MTLTIQLVPVIILLCQDVKRCWTCQVVCKKSPPKVRVVLKRVRFKLSTGKLGVLQVGVFFPQASSGDDPKTPKNQRAKTWAFEFGKSSSLWHVFWDAVVSFSFQYLSCSLPVARFFTITKNHSRQDLQTQKFVSAKRLISQDLIRCNLALGYCWWFRNPAPVDR